MDAFSIPWAPVKMFGIEFKTEIDSERTNHEQRNALKTNPAYDWLIRVPKSKANYLALKAFFVARKGCWDAFYWKWDSTIDDAGDDVTYIVRFGVDRFEFVSDENYWLVPLVVTNT